MDLPKNIFSGDTRFELEEPLDRLQTLLNNKNIDVDNLDLRGDDDKTTIEIGGFSDPELNIITNFVDADPELRIKSRDVRDLNEKFDKNLINNNPMFIFSTDLETRNNIQTIRTGINSFVTNRDMFITPPTPDIQQKIFELLSKNEKN